MTINRRRVFVVINAEGHMRTDCVRPTEMLAVQAAVARVGKPWKTLLAQGYSVTPARLQRFSDAEE